jgi:hypothetical protein
MTRILWICADFLPDKKHIIRHLGFFRPNEKENIMSPALIFNFQFSIKIHRNNRFTGQFTASEDCCARSAFVFSSSFAGFPYRFLSSGLPDAIFLQSKISNHLYFNQRPKYY